MSKIKGTNISAPIVPYATSDSYPTHYAKYGKGGFVSLSTYSDLEAIPLERIEEGMLAYVLEEGQSYQYLGGSWVTARVGKENSLIFPDSSTYNARVENGVVVAYNETTKIRLPLGNYKNIKINSFYLGYGNGKLNNSHNFLPCSHRFIELSNIGKERQSLYGLFIKLYYGGTWKTIELNGFIEPGSTYLLRGQQTSILDCEETYIKVNQYNQIWEGSEDVNATSGLTIYLCWGDKEGRVLGADGSYIDNPVTSEDILESQSYIDCVSTSESSMTGDCIKRDNKYATLEKIIFVRKCPLDPSYIDTKRNSVDWRYHFIENDDYKPGASYEGKNITWGNDWFEEEGITTLTCTVGRRVGISDEGSASRCFTWTTKNQNSDHFYIKKQGDSDWTTIYGIIDGAEYNDFRSKCNLPTTSGIDLGTSAFHNLSYYTKKTWETYTGEVIYTYKVILAFSEVGEYLYSGDKISTKTFQISDGTTELGYLQTGNFNIDTKESAILLKGVTESLAGKNVDFIVNTGNIVKHGTRPQEWIYYIKNNKLSDRFAEFITPGENDLGEVNLYDLGGEKVNYRMIDLFYTFEYGQENTPEFNGVLMPGLYSTDYFGHLLVSFNSTIITDPGDTEHLTYTTTRDIMGVTDLIKTDLPGNTDLGIASEYYYHELEWLFKELYYYWNKDDFKNLRETITMKEMKSPNFTLPIGDWYLPDHVTIVMNHAPIEPFTDEMYDEMTTTRSIGRDNINYHLLFLVSRFFKLWQIKLVLGNNDLGVAGITKRIHDANLSYMPSTWKSNYRDLLVTGLQNYDTFQPIIITEDTSVASELAVDQSYRFFWNGTDTAITVQFKSGGYTTVQPGSYESTGLIQNGKYSILLASPGNREDGCAPRYSLLSSTLNTLGDAEKVGYVKSWFEGNSEPKTGYPTVALHRQSTVTYLGVKFDEIGDINQFNLEEDEQLMPGKEPKISGTVVTTLNEFSY